MNTETLNYIEGIPTSRKPDEGDIKAIFKWRCQRAANRVARSAGSNRATRWALSEDVEEPTVVEMTPGSYFTKSGKRIHSPNAYRRVTGAWKNMVYHAAQCTVVLPANPEKLSNLLK